MKANVNVNVTCHGNDSTQMSQMWTGQYICYTS